MTAPRIVYRLPRICGPCHDGDHGDACELVLYASPRVPEALCECPTCHSVRREVIPCDDPRHPDYGARKGAAA